MTLGLKSNMPMQVSFREWDDSVSAHRAVASLGRDEVQVWTATVPVGEWGQTVPDHILSGDEWERAERFSVGEPRRQFVFGRTFLRQLLGACRKVDPSTLVFGYGLRGKPFLAQSCIGGDLRFNLSHSGRMAAIALACGREIGVDIESIHRLEDWSPLTGRVFSQRELNELRSLPDRLQREAFFQGWTRKEAYLKATGEGLTDTLPCIEVTLGSGKKPEFIGLPAGPEAARLWEIRTVPLPPGYVGAIVFEKNLESLQK